MLCSGPLRNWLSDGGGVHQHVAAGWGLAAVIEVTTSNLGRGTVRAGALDLSGRRPAPAAIRDGDAAGGHMLPEGKVGQLD